MKYLHIKLSIIIFLILLMPLGALAQANLSEDFLNSLPKSVQEDLMSQNDDADNELEDNFNQKPDTRLDKLESALSEIRDNLDSIEAAIDEDPLDLQIFGLNFFSSFQTSFSPINAPRLMSSYTLDVGDILNIQLLGKKNELMRAPIDPDGSIMIKGVGQVSIAGLSLETATTAIKLFISSRILGAEVIISIDRLRDMNILLLGSAENPGMYTLPGGSSVLGLLHAAGGLSSSGSFRSIIHKRDNQIIQTIDLYELLIRGNVNFKHNLRNGDVILIDPVKKHVSISGGIARPAIYELGNGDDLLELMELAGGLNFQDETASIKVIRKNGVIEIFESPESVSLSGGDSVFIPSYQPLTKEIFTVTINGAVNSPGVYSIAPGQKLSEIIKLAGGYSENAYPLAGVLTRQSVAQAQKLMLDKTYDQLINYLASSSSSIGGLSSSNLQLILPQIKGQKVAGRIAAEFNLLKLETNPNIDTILANGDNIVIPYFTSEVKVFGQVQNPTALIQDPTLSYDDYIKAAGGFDRFADKNRVVIIQPNGKALFVNESSLFFKSRNIIYPGSTIFVPRDIGKVEGINLAATIAPIFSSLAISIASLNSINN
jgi:protein involved in polysaccharide export with SLBB domain